MSKRLIAFAVLTVVFVSGCKSNRVIGRYKSAMCETSGSKKISCTAVIPTASAYAVSIKTPPPLSPAGGAAFPESALVAYINALANSKMSPTAIDLRTNLAAPLASSSSPAAGGSPVFHRTMIVTVRKEGFNPADRLEATDVTIEPENAKFDSWDTLATAYTSINAGTLQLTHGQGATESLSAGAPSDAPVSVSASVGGSQTNARVENLTAANQAETLSASVEKDGRALVIHRQGGYGIDLTGNTVIQVDISYTGNAMSLYIFSAPNYVDAKGKWLPAKQVVLEATPVFEVPPGTYIPARVTLIYTIRHVTSGDATYEETDDDVLELTSAPVIKNVILIPAGDVSPPGFGLWETTGPTKDFPMNIGGSGRGPVGLCFDSYNKASDFLAYMKAANAKNPSQIGSARLGFHVPPNFELEPLSPSELVGLEIRSRCF